MKPNKFKNRNVSSRVRRDIKEQDYWGKLSSDEQEWLFQFMLEYNQANFNFDKQIHSDSYKKDCYNRNNSALRSYDNLSNIQQIEVLNELYIKHKKSSKYYLPEEYCTLEDEYEFLD